MICYMKCVRCGEFAKCESSGDYQRPPRLPIGWSQIIFHKDQPNSGYDLARVVCPPCTAFFVLLIHDNMPHREL